MSMWKAVHACVQVVGPNVVFTIQFDVPFSGTIIEADLHRLSYLHTFLFVSPHTLPNRSIKNIYLCYRQSGEEALGETIGLIG